MRCILGSVIVMALCNISIARLPPPEFHTLETGARVTRGDDWIWQDQDGGNGSKGTVAAIVDWDGQVNCGAKVVWDSGHWNVYRWGANGGTLWDLKVVAGEFIADFKWQEPVKATGELSDPLQTTALLDLFLSTGGPHTWRMRNGWSDGTDPCLGGWVGVTCDTNGKLIALRLDNNKLEGRIPDSIGQLKDLVTLDLSFNSLQGTLPKTLGTLKQLRFLELQLNKLTGSLPSELSHCTQLEWISLSRNRFVGTIPTELDNLTSLKYLRLAHNDLHGQVPVRIASIPQQSDGQLLMDGNRLIII